MTLIFSFESCSSLFVQLHPSYQFSENIFPDSEGLYASELVFIPDETRIRKAESYFDSAQYYDISSNTDSLLALYQMENAVQYILEQSKSEQIIILNEAHHAPHHRLFARSLLAGLKNNGYVNFGVEGLTNSPHFYLTEYPKPSNGYYLKEPSYGHLIREALQLGFNVFPYEANAQHGREREITQARNIIKNIEESDSGKTFIYCGYSHNDEGDLRTWEKSMAGRLKEYLGIDPYTVNQFLYNNIENNETDEAFVLKDSLDHTVEISHRFDLFVFHPQRAIGEKIPLWKKKKGDEFIRIDFLPEDICFPVIVAGYMNKEQIRKGVPLDIVEVINSKDEKWLCLPTEKNYKIVIFDCQRKHIKTSNF